MDAVTFERAGRLLGLIISEVRIGSATLEYIKNDGTFLYRWYVRIDGKAHGAVYEISRRQLSLAVTTGAIDEIAERVAFDWKASL